MKRKWNLTALLLSVLLLGPVFADTAYAAEESWVYDQAGLFSEEESALIDEEIQSLRSETDMDYLVVTTDDAEGKSARDYADDFYEASGAGTHGNYSGMLYLIDMDNREIYISAEGDMMRYLTDDRVDSILDNAFNEVADGNYADSALSVLKDTGSYIAQGIPEDQYNYSSETGEIDPYSQEKGFPVLALVFGAVAGLVAAIATFLGVKGKYQLTFETYHYPLSEKSSMRLSVSEDRLVNQFVTHRRIPKNPPSSGGRSSGARTTTHRSSSGRTHSGGGRKF